MTSITDGSLDVSVLGVLINEPKLMSLCKSEGITAEFFCDVQCKQLFGLIDDLFRRGSAIDPIILMSHRDDLSGLIATCVSAGYVPTYLPDYIEQMRRRANVRKCLDALPGLIEMASLPDASDGELLAAIEALGLSVRGSMGRGKHRSTAELADNATVEFDKGPLETLPIWPPGTECDMLIEVRQSELTVMAGESGGGKTALLVQWATELLRNGRAVTYCCTESSAGDLFYRFAGAVSGVPHNIALGKFVTPKSRQKFRDAFAVVRGFGSRLQLIGCGSGAVTPSLVDAAVRRCILENGRCDACVVDFVQDVRADGASPRASNLDKMNAVISDLHAISLTHGVGMFAASQLNRRANDDDGRLGLDRLKESSLLGQLAHSVIFLNRDKSKDDLAVLEVVKSRNGRRTIIPVRWEGAGYVSAQYNQETMP